MNQPVLTPRDLDLFRFLHSYGLIKTSDLSLRFFSGIAPTTMFRRLRRLEGRGLIARIHGLPGGELAWRVTEKGAAKVASTPPRRYFPKQSLEHDLEIVDLRLALERVGAALSWIPEHELRRHAAAKYGPHGSTFKIVPDGWMGCNFQGQSHDVAIELELHLKNKDRYQRTFNEYRYSSKLVAVWYLVATKSLGKRLNQLWLKGGGASVYFIWAVAKEVREDALNATIYSDDRTYRFTDLFSPLKLIPAPPARAQPPAQGVSGVGEESPSKIASLSVEDLSEKAAPEFR